MNVKFLAKVYHKTFNLFSCLPLLSQVKILSSARLSYMDKLYQQKPAKKIMLDIPEQLAVTLWGIEFRSPLFNSAGMFKNGECYDLMTNIGAGAYIGGTSTNNPREGNTKESIQLPFITLPKSQTSVNFLGLPNLGDEHLSIQMITKNKVRGCPIGWSVMRSPDFAEDGGLVRLVKSLWMYHNNSLIDFIELNESCPNIGSDPSNIINRLKYVAENFVIKRTRKLPIVVKLSNDISYDSLKAILQVMFEYKFDGINLGNTSTNYNKVSEQLVGSERQLFDFFTTKFGGGIGGHLLKQNSLELCKKAKQIVDEANLDYEFHIIRSGGVDCAQDLIDSKNAGVSLNQWYTGFFSNYVNNGAKVYKKLYNQL